MTPAGPCVSGGMRSALRSLSHAGPVQKPLNVNPVEALLRLGWTQAPGPAGFPPHLLWPAHLLRSGPDTHYRDLSEPPEGLWAEATRAHGMAERAALGYSMWQRLFLPGKVTLTGRTSPSKEPRYSEAPAYPVFP